MAAACYSGQQRLQQAHAVLQVLKVDVTVLLRMLTAAGELFWSQSCHIAVQPPPELYRGALRCLLRRGGVQGLHMISGLQTHRRISHQS